MVEVSRLHTFYSPSSLSSSLIDCQEEKEYIEKGLLGDGWSDSRESSSGSERFTFFFPFPISIVKKVQTLTKLLSLQGKRKKEGKSGKGPKFFQIFSSGKVFLFFPSPPIVAQNPSNCCTCAPVGQLGWGSGHGVKVYNRKSLFSNFHMLLKNKAGHKQCKYLVLELLHN